MTGMTSRKGEGEPHGDQSPITRSDLIRASLNVGSLGLSFSWTYYKQMGIGFGLMIVGLLKKIYRGRPDDFAAALRRHVSFFNITMPVGPFVGGIVVAMEEQIARGELEPQAVQDVKTALMGPLSGIGDSIFLSTIRVVAAGIGISLCQQGSWFGPLAFLLIYNVPAWGLRVWGIQKGYEVGVGFLERAQRSGAMTKIVGALGIVGVMVLGAMCDSTVAVNLAVTIGAGDAPTTLQQILDGIMPGMLGMAAFWIYYKALGRKMSPIVLILVTMVIGVIGSYLGILA